MDSECHATRGRTRWGCEARFIESTVEHEVVILEGAAELRAGGGMVGVVKMSFLQKEDGGPDRADQQINVQGVGAQILAIESGDGGGY